MKDLKLTIELIPQNAWYNNLRTVLPLSEWEKICKKAYADYGYKCAICGAAGKLNCHELWEYDSQHRAQKLIGFIALCDGCHYVKHIGLAGILALQGNLDYERVVQHFMTVNGCDRKTFEEHRQEALRQRHERAQHEWDDIDLGQYRTLVHPGLKSS